MKYDVFRYRVNGTDHFFSKCITREFGENKLIFVEGHQIIACVQPLRDSGDLELIGYTYAYEGGN